MKLKYQKYDIQTQQKYEDIIKKQKLQTEDQLKKKENLYSKLKNEKETADIELQNIKNKLYKAVKDGVSSIAVLTLQIENRRG